MKRNIVSLVLLSNLALGAEISADANYAHYTHYKPLVETGFTSWVNQQHIGAKQIFFKIFDDINTLRVVDEESCNELQEYNDTLYRRFLSCKKIELPGNFDPNETTYFSAYMKYIYDQYKSLADQLPTWEFAESLFESEASSYMALLDSFDSQDDSMEVDLRTDCENQENSTESLDVTRHDFFSPAQIDTIVFAINKGQKPEIIASGLILNKSLTDNQRLMISTQKKSIKNLILGVIWNLLDQGQPIPGFLTSDQLQYILDHPLDAPRDVYDYFYRNSMITPSQKIKFDVSKDMQKNFVDEIKAYLPI